MQRNFHNGMDMTLPVMAFLFAAWRDVQRNGLGHDPPGGGVRRVSIRCLAGRAA